MTIEPHLILDINIPNFYLQEHNIFSFTEIRYNCQYLHMHDLLVLGVKSIQSGLPNYLITTSAGSLMPAVPRCTRTSASTFR